MQSQYEAYVPLRGFEEADDEGKRVLRTAGGKGFNVRGAETMKALGRASRAGNILENIISDYERAVVRAERNNVGKAFLDLVTTNPDPDLWEIDAVRTSRTKASGCSHAAKCPPLSSVPQWTSRSQCRSNHLRGVGSTSFGNALAATGIVIGPAVKLPKLSQ